MKLCLIILTALSVGLFTVINPETLSAQTGTLASTQVVRGSVFNANTQTPVRSAVVRIVEINNGAISNADGQFKIRNVPAGRYTMRVTLLGYETLSLPIVVTSGKEVLINVPLVEKILRTEAATVSARKEGFTPINEASLISANVFSLDDAYRFAGARGDVARMASGFAGVLSANDTRNDIIIRGGAPTELLWRLDGLDIPNPNHFATQGATGGPVGAINSNMLANSDFLTGAFAAEYGDRMSGVFDLRTRNGNNEKYEFVGQFGFNGVEAMAEGPLPFGTQSDGQSATENAVKGSFLVGYRKSFLEILEALGTRFTGAGVPRYEDLSLKVHLDIGTQHKIWLSGLLTTSDIFMQYSNGTSLRTGEQDTRNGTDVVALGLHWQALFSDRAFGKLMVGYVSSRFRTDVDSITARSDGGLQGTTPWYRNRAAEGYWTAKYNISFSPDARSVFTGAVETRLRTYDLDEYRTTTSRFSNVLFSVKANGTALQTLSFVNWNYRFSDELRMNLGLHSQYLGVSNRATLEPRLAFAWNPALQHTFTLGTGVYRQSQPLAVYLDTTPGVDNRGLDFSQAIHYVAGYSFAAASDMLLKAEAYYKDYSHIPVSAGAATSFSAMNLGTNFGSISGLGNLVNSGTGRSYGAEFSFSKQFANSWYALASLSLVRQEYQGSDKIWRSGAFDNGYIATVLAGYEWKIAEAFSMEFSARYARAGGAPTTPVNVELSRRFQATVLNTQEAFSVRLPDYERIDARIDFRNNFNGWSLISYVSMENLLNRANLLGYAYSPTRDAVVGTAQLGRFFVGGVRVEF
ncbi:MAG: TonB-dependent receptor [Candidatus Kapabacteria bacterium]|jgi:hypothetical protein|nr:TonB-dependent receptor [Candidatus Kapabacteria bacterium]